MRESNLKFHFRIDTIRYVYIYTYIYIYIYTYKYVCVFILCLWSFPCCSLACPLCVCCCRWLDHFSRGPFGCCRRRCVRLCCLSSVWGLILVICTNSNKDQHNKQTKKNLKFLRFLAWCIFPVSCMWGAVAPSLFEAY